MFNNNWRNELKPYRFKCDVEVNDTSYIPEGSIVLGGKKFLDRDYTTIFHNGKPIDFIDECLEEDRRGS